MVTFVTGGILIWGRTKNKNDSFFMAIIGNSAVPERYKELVHLSTSSRKGRSRLPNIDVGANYT